MTSPLQTRVLPLIGPGKIGLLTSGGDAPGMNAAVRSATKVALARGHRVYGIRHGYKGLLDGQLVPMDHGDVDDIVRWGGTVLGSARELRFKEPAGKALAQDRVMEFGLDGVVVIGGDGSLTGARELSKLTTARGEPLRVMGIPASIDNDVGCTSLAIGVDTAVNTIVGAVDRIADTARAHDRTFIVEVMGRDCGYLAMVAAIASAADAVLYRESGRSHDEMLSHLEQTVRQAYRPGGKRSRAKRMVVILKAEGVTLSSARIKEHLDEALLKEIPTLETRVTVLGHLVRGGAPTAMDRLMAARLGNVAVIALENGRTAMMAAWRPPVGGEETMDKDVRLFDLNTVLTETAALRAATSPVAKKRVEMLQAVESIFAL
ncbi:MAG: 6-phosphofructokinase [Deltaproteobacteria bacterium]|nr:6-phosphofructokinase [Deltaproteobacteria bacterium]